MKRNRERDTTIWIVMSKDGKFLGKHGCWTTQSRLAEHFTAEQAGFAIFVHPCAMALRVDPDTYNAEQTRKLKSFLDHIATPCAAVAA